MSRLPIKYRNTYDLVSVGLTKLSLGSIVLTVVKLHSKGQCCIHKQVISIIRGCGAWDDEVTGGAWYQCHRTDNQLHN